MDMVKAIKVANAYHMNLGLLITIYEILIEIQLENQQDLLNEEKKKIFIDCKNKLIKFAHECVDNVSNQRKKECSNKILEILIKFSDPNNNPVDIKNELQKLSGIIF